MKHIGMFEREKCVLLGFSRERGEKVMLVPLSRITSADQRWLSDVISTGVAQRTNFIVPELLRQIHPSGQDGFTYLTRFSVEVPAYQVSVGDRDQAMTWFGRGTSNFDAALEQDRIIVPPDHDDVKEIPESAVTVHAQKAAIAAAQRAALEGPKFHEDPRPTPSADLKLDLILAQLVNLTSRVNSLETVAPKATKRPRPKPKNQKVNTKVVPL